VLEDPRDRENVYIYVSGSAPVRPAEELPGCVGAPPGEDPNSALFRIEVIRVPLANPAQAAIVSSPRIFEGLVAPPRHGLAPDDRAALEAARARGEFVVEVMGEMFRVPPRATAPMLDSIVRQRGGTGAPTAADSAQLREGLPAMIERMIVAAGTGGRAAPRTDAVPRHHRLPRHRPRRRRLRGVRHPARHLRPGQPAPDRRGRRLELRLLALGHLQQRRHQGAVQR
jgi:hypothetical protein